MVSLQVSTGALKVCACSVQQEGFEVRKNTLAVCKDGAIVG